MSRTGWRVLSRLLATLKPIEQIGRTPIRNRRGWVLAVRDSDGALHGTGMHFSGPLQARLAQWRLNAERRLDPDHAQRYCVESVGIGECRRRGHLWGPRDWIRLCSVPRSVILGLPGLPVPTPSKTPKAHLHLDPSNEGNLLVMANCHKCMRCFSCLESIEDLEKQAEVALQLRRGTLSAFRTPPPRPRTQMVASSPY